MIDFIKILVLNPDIEFLKQNEQLDFIIEVNESTAEFSNKKIAHYHFCKVIIYESGSVFFTGSIHKLWNSINDVRSPNYSKKGYKGFNGNQFTLKDIQEVRNHLESLLNCKSNQMIFQNIEFGINAEVSFQPNLFLKGLLYHRDKLFEFRFNNSYAQSMHQRFIFKIYNKSKQYGMKTNTLRIELKIIKTEEIKPLELKTFEDVNLSSIEGAKELILKRFNEIVCYDYTIDHNALNKSLKKALRKYSNPRYWIEELKPIHRDRPKKCLKKIINTYSENLHQQISFELEEKCVIINR